MNFLIHCLVCESRIYCLTDGEKEGRFCPICGAAMERLESDKEDPE